MAKIVLTRGQKNKAAARDLTVKAKKLMAYEGITQKQLAEYCGVAASEISKELNNVLMFRTFVAICELTGREALSTKETI